MRSWGVAVGLVVVLTASPSRAQWVVDRSEGFVIAMGSGDDDRIHIAVSCQGDTPAILLSSTGVFANGTVQSVWSDGSVDHYTFQNGGETLQGLATTPTSRGMLDKLRRLNSAAISVFTRAGAVTDIVSLSESARTINSLSCIASTRRAAPARRPSVAAAPAAPAPPPAGPAPAGPAYTAPFVGPVGAPDGPQWLIVTDTAGTTFAAATSLARTLTMGIACTGAGRDVVIRSPDRNFRGGRVDVETRWPDGTRDRYAFVGSGTVLTASTDPDSGRSFNPEITRFIGKLRVRESVQIIAPVGSAGIAVDRFRLSDLPQTLDSLPCNVQE